MDCAECGATMKLAGRKKFSSHNPGGGTAGGHRLRASGHPAAALAAGAIYGAANIANKFLATDKYECPDCGNTASKTARR